MTLSIGALTISQSPRDDLLEPLRERFSSLEIIEVGALDGLDITLLPDGSKAAYPLTTRLRNGTSVTLDSAFLELLLQTALDELEGQGVIVSVLLCAGAFSNLGGTKPLVKPFEFACSVLRAMGVQCIGVVSPIEIQKMPIQKKWLEAGFAPIVWVMPDKATSQQTIAWLKRQLAAYSDVTCVVLDYVGYPVDMIYQLQTEIDRPVFDLGLLAISGLSSMLE